MVHEGYRLSPLHRAFSRAVLTGIERPRNLGERDSGNCERAGAAGGPAYGRPGATFIAAKMPPLIPAIHTLR